MPDNAAGYHPQRNNCESPDLYGVFPFRVYGLSRGAHPIDEAREAWQRMPNPGHVWPVPGGRERGAAQPRGRRAQGCPAAGAQSDATQRQGGRGLPFPRLFRFVARPVPRFRRPGQQDEHVAGNARAEPGPGGEILLLPAWLREWDAGFRLFAPGGVRIDGGVKGGRLVRWRTGPSPRARVKVLGGDARRVRRLSSARRDAAGPPRRWRRR